MPPSNRHQVRQALRRLDENSITYITLAEDAESVELYDAVLEIDADGAWNWRRTGRGCKRRRSDLILRRKNWHELDRAAFTIFARDFSAASGVGAC